jgi:hypothetical protein
MWIFTLLVMAGALASAQTVDKLELHKVRAEAADFQGKKAVHLTQTPNANGEDTLAIVPGLQFQDGTIEVDVAGALAPNAFGDARGFIGVAFRVQPTASRFEAFYIRPTNGRADDQLRRNHSAQYFSFPDWPWHRTRKETPGLYESYVDLQPGVWTRLRVKVSGTRAELYVDGAEQPSLIVRDLKLGVTAGRVALWTDPTTEAYFRDLRVRRAR